MRGQRLELAGQGSRRTMGMKGKTERDCVLRMRKFAVLWMKVKVVFVEGEFTFLVAAVAPFFLSSILHARR